MSSTSKKEFHPKDLDALETESSRIMPIAILPSKRGSSVLAMLSDPESQAAEQYRLLAHMIEKQHSKKEGLTLSISSAIEGEGKTVTSINLAFALAEGRTKKVLLIDADSRGGRVTETMGLGNPAGLTNVLQEETKILDALLQVDKNLTILPSGSPTAHPVGLFRSVAWKEIIQSCRKHFDIIVLDCPPICVSEEMTVLQDVADKVLLVVRSEVSKQEQVKEASEKIGAEKLIGLILNGAEGTEKRYRRNKQES